MVAGDEVYAEEQRGQAKVKVVDAERAYEQARAGGVARDLNR